MSALAVINGLVAILLIVSPQSPKQQPSTHEPSKNGDGNYVETITRLAQVLSKRDVDPDSLNALIPGRLRQTKDDSRVFVDRNVKTVLRIGSFNNHSFVRQLEMHFDPARRLLLKHLSQIWGPPTLVAEGEECSVRWNVNPEALVVYAQLLSRTSAPDAIVLSLEMRSTPPEP